MDKHCDCKHHLHCMCLKCGYLERKLCEICKKCGQAGPPGKDGITPHIGENENWWIGNVDTGISAKGIKGDQGEIGPQGLQGEKGDKGEPGENQTIKALQMQMEGYAGYEIDVFRYDKTIFDTMDGAVYFAELSAFVVTEPGIYKIDWQVSYNTDNLTLENGLIISLYIHNVNYSQIIIDNNGSAYGQANGSAIFKIEDFGELPLTFHLRCESEEAVKYSNVPVQSNITILKIR